eukprot:TRINITY_DN2083_c0_g1::TRINITY_DN2083_c0_g1_i2::g.21878::m.21878 TRINITY_DN2083_c0_g1::TRINITY_DN2083_c0_g1_i2::g.21878  ORF type:complete len:361 (+),score=35.72,sp/Q8GYY1/HSFA3_ARATH/43.66/4e-28,HSF_DNA-bind/PF00447.12/6.4e-31,DUF4461/PF14688.1/0.036 TRINITY_DN2083_c0_g1_i2:147-1229(+)
MSADLQSQMQHRPQHLTSDMSGQGSVSDPTMGSATVTYALRPTAFGGPDGSMGGGPGGVSAPILGVQGSGMPESPTQQGFEMDMEGVSGDEASSQALDQIRVHSSSWEQQGELHGVPAFLRKCYDIVNNEMIPDIQWSKDGLSFVILDPASFSKKILPKAFKHNNFSSFVRQLNFYGFHKCSGNNKDVCEFRHDYFRRGAKHLLKLIKRNGHTSANKDTFKRDKTDSEEAEKLKGEVELLRREIQDVRKEMVALHQGLMNFQYANHCQVEGLQFQITELRTLLQQNGISMNNNVQAGRLMRPNSGPVVSQVVMSGIPTASVSSGPPQAPVVSGVPNGGPGLPGVNSSVSAGPQDGSPGSE